MTAGPIDMIVGTDRSWRGAQDLANVPTVSTPYLQGVVDFALTRGLSRRALLTHAGVDEADLAALDTRHPVDALLALLRAGAALAEDPAFALHFGEYVPCERVSLAAPIGGAAKDVTEALALVNRYTPLSIDFPALAGSDRYAFVTDAAGLWLVDRRPADDRAELTELVFSRMTQGIRRVQRSDVLRAVHVRHAAPAHRAHYARIFRVPVHFGSGRNALLLDPSYQFTPLTPAPAHVTRVLAAHADAKLDELAQQRSCRGRLERELRVVLPHGDVGIAAMARRMAMSRQTLYRRLKAEGVTYEQVLSALRRAMAEELLRAGALSVREVASRLGFADAAAFSRAFKRWTGRSPKALLPAPGRP